MEDRDKLLSQIINGWAEHLADRWDLHYNGNYRPATDEEFLALGFTEEELNEGDVPLVFTHADGTMLQVELEAFAQPISKEIRDEALARLRRIAEQLQKRGEASERREKAANSGE